MNSNGAVSETTITDQSDKTYEIENGQNFQIAAVPKSNSYNTTFGFEYWNDG